MAANSIIAEVKNARICILPKVKVTHRGGFRSTRFAAS